MNYFKELRIAKLIAAYLLGTINDEERRILDRWEGESEHNHALFRKLTKENIDHYFNSDDNRDDIENVIAQIHARISTSQRNHKRRKPLRRPFSWIALAAGSFTLIVGLSIFISRFENTSPTETLSNTIPDPASKVRIILPSGKEIKFDEMSDTVAECGGVINREGSSLVFSHEDVDFENTAEPVMTTIVTELGGELSFRLSDGTSVWLNNGSEFSFPMEFGTGDRRVKLKGEAYFEVSHDPAKPFVVTTGDMDIRVLGTVFNVKSYSDETSATATLLSGRISVAAGGVTRNIEPGFAATVDRETGKVSVSAADTFAATAWLHGQLVFVDEGIEAVLRTLSRWYGVNFVYDGLEIGKYTFNGRMTKYDPLSESLNRITLAGGPSFSIDGDTVYLR